MSMNVKSPSPPFIFFVKKCDPPREAVKFIVTHPFLLTNMVCGWIVQRSLTSSSSDWVSESFVASAVSAALNVKILPHKPLLM